MNINNIKYKIMWGVGLDIRWVVGLGIGAGYWFIPRGKGLGVRV